MPVYKARCPNCGTHDNVQLLVRTVVSLTSFELDDNGTLIDFDPNSMLDDWQEALSDEYEFYCADCERYINAEVVLVEDPIEAEAWRDASRDKIIVKVRIWSRDDGGNPTKRGVAFELTDEMLQTIPEGSEYPRITVGPAEPPVVPAYRRD